MKGGQVPASDKPLPLGVPADDGSENNHSVRPLAPGVPGGGSPGLQFQPHAQGPPFMGQHRPPFQQMNHFRPPGSLPTLQQGPPFQPNMQNPPQHFPRGPPNGPFPPRPNHQHPGQFHNFPPQQHPNNPGGQVRIFCLGEYVYSTLSKRVEDVYDLLYKIARQWSVDFAVQKFLNLMVLMNPRLNCRQQAHLKPLLTRALDQLLWQRALDPQVMRGLVALACPNRDTALLFGYLLFSPLDTIGTEDSLLLSCAVRQVEIIAGLVCNNPTIEADLKSNTDVEAAAAASSKLQILQEKAKVAQCLYQHYCLEQVYVAAMPSPVRKAVLTALMGGTEVSLLGTGFLDASSQGLQHSAPICCITLEPLLGPDGTIAPDVVAVIQRSAILSKQHAFLYRGRALFEWLSSSAVPKSPETRTMVLPTDIYRLS